MRNFLTAAAANIVLVLGVAGLASATDNPFVAYDTAADGTQSPSAHSTVTADAVTLTWAAGEDASAAGTSAETSNLGLDVEDGDQIAVTYELLDGADPAAGSVRLFVYYTAGADTWAQAPDQVAVAPADGTTSGTLSITAAGGTIGTAGVVYDTSNGGVEGTVSFSGLTVAGEPAPFLPATDPDPDPTKDPEPDPTTEPEPTEEPTEPAPVPTAVPAGTTLPDTGVSALLLGLFGAGLLGAGGGLAFWAHRR